jgi:hypothetical protein
MNFGEVFAPTRKVTTSRVRRVHKSCLHRGRLTPIRAERGGAFLNFPRITVPRCLRRAAPFFQSQSSFLSTAARCFISPPAGHLLTSPSAYFPTRGRGFTTRERELLKGMLLFGGVLDYIGARLEEM